MAGQESCKLKPFLLMRFLQQNTDENHGATIDEMIEWLGERGVPAERKSLYRDLNLLREFGMDIAAVRGRRQEYRLLSREFQLPELKLLIDAVSASRFITRKKSRELTEKLASLASVYEARELNRGVYADKRNKALNESIYYTIDAIHAAINHGKKLSFKYYTYRPDKRRVLKKSGQAYVVTPIALSYSGENYYLHGWSAEHGAVRTYRVDRMASAAELDQPADKNEQIASFDPSTHANEAFSMYGGEAQKVTLRFDNALADAAIDRFGSDILLVPDGEDGFTVHAEVMVSPTFFGWVFGFGGRVRIIAPEAVRAEYARSLALQARAHGAAQLRDVRPAGRKPRGE